MHYAGSQSLPRRHSWAGRRPVPAETFAIEADCRFHGELHKEIAAGGWARDLGQNGTLQHIVSCLARYLRAPVVLQGRNLVTLAEGGAGAASIALAPGRHQSVRDVLMPLACYHDAQVLPSLGAAPGRLVMPVRAGGEVLGFLITTSASPEAGARRALECAAAFVAFERLIQADREAAQELDREALLTDLCSGYSLHRLLHHGLRMGIDLRRAYFPCAFLATPSSPERTAQLRNLVLDAVRESLLPPADALGAVVDDLVVALVPEQMAGRLGAVCDRVMSRARDVSLRARAGVGPLCRELTDYQEAVRKARWVTEVLAAKDGRDWATFDDLGIYAVLFDQERPAQLHEFVTHQLETLMSYDELRGTDLVGTLSGVLDAGGVLTTAASRLHVHISTLKYRVSRIEELLGVDLRDPQAAFNLHLACKILEISGQPAVGGQGGNDVGTETTGAVARTRGQKGQRRPPRRLPH